jgi:hypothetical protein
MASSDDHRELLQRLKAQRNRLHGDLDAGRLAADPVRSDSIPFTNHELALIAEHRPADVIGVGE